MAASWVLTKAEQFIFSTPRVFFCGVLWLIALLKVGVWCIPNLPAYRAIALIPLLIPLSTLMHTTSCGAGLHPGLLGCYISILR